MYAFIGPPVMPFGWIATGKFGGATNPDVKEGISPFFTLFDRFVDGFFG